METNLFSKLDAAVAEYRTTITRDPDTFTTKDYAENTGINSSSALKRLVLLAKQGTIIRARVPQLQSNNRIQVVDGWKYVGQQSAEQGQVGSGVSSGRSGTGRRGKSQGKKVVVTGVAASDR